MAFKDHQYKRLAKYTKAIPFTNQQKKEKDPLYAQTIQDNQGVPMDDVRAHMWFNLAAVKGDADDVKIRDTIANLLTPQQIANRLIIAPSNMQ